MHACVNSLPNDQIINLSKLKAFTDNKINVTQQLKFELGRVENIMGKGENAGYQHFLLSSSLQCYRLSYGAHQHNFGVV